MISLARSTVVLALAVATALPVAAQRGDDSRRKSKNGRAEGTAGEATIRIDYGRPAAGGREIWGALVPYGAVWRTGADEATTVSVDRDVLVEGSPLAAGTYSLFTVPGERSWTVIFNRVAEQWGAFRYDSAQDALRVEVEPRERPFVERFEIAVENDAIVLRWAELEVPVRVGATH